jgi:hypothetical protein
LRRLITMKITFRSRNFWRTQHLSVTMMATMWRRSSSRPRDARAASYRKKFGPK